MLRFIFSSLFAVGLVAAGSASAITLNDNSAGIPENHQIFAHSLTIPGPGARIDLRSEAAISLRPARWSSAGNSLFGRRSFEWHDEIPEQARDHWHYFENFQERSEDFRGLLDRLFELALRFHERWNDSSGVTIPDRPTNSVPEPNAALLIASGIVGIGLWRRSRR